ncbi:hypothetical protein BDP27DRAFT_1023800 [Rhodocollybia butyracea]|uniref:Uncharacterized protein n=1 Tax=Rhodocollybia butyracea TaxID=206335 RepID=A0A9P5PLX9_9AGAR|nr:hypothetical protein BDP27DRAFT_1023800 [Rhodocollybia butyracea]
MYRRHLEMFSRSHNNSFTNRNFFNIGGDSKQEKAASSLCIAVPYDAEARYPPPRCHPGTHKAILNDLEGWVLQKIVFSGSMSLQEQESHLFLRHLWKSAQEKEL